MYYLYSFGRYEFDTFIGIFESIDLDRFKILISELIIFVFL
jgi:hypothetical protein